MYFAFINERLCVCLHERLNLLDEMSKKKEIYMRTTTPVFVPIFQLENWQISNHIYLETS